MDDTPLTKRPWFYIVAWLVVLLIVYGWQIARMGGLRASLFDFLFDIFLLFPAILIFWMTFFAQFVLPVTTRADRKKIVSRLFSDLFGSHGPALFIENGTIKEHSGERMKRGPGVVWLDSASAAVTRTAVKIKQTLGPGVHFIESGEFIAGTVDLHVQTQTLGPREEDELFDPEDEGQDPFVNDSDPVNERRKMVSALTRDGIEVVPSITIKFRIDTGFPKDGEPGSRFGYRSGASKKARENEAKDMEAIRRAILGEGVNPSIVSDSTRRRVAWNELPASLAVDLWREYVSKFTLDQLFKPDQLVPPPAPEPPQPTDEEFDPLSQPVLVTQSRNTTQDRLAVLLREVNVMLSRTIRWFENTQADHKMEPTPAFEPFRSPPPAKAEYVHKTALQVVNDMVNERLKKPEVTIMDDHGVRGQGVVPSPEYRLLKERGIQVLSVSIGKLRFAPVIEETIINRWSSSWYENAKAESRQIERRQDIVRTAAQEKAIYQYANRLSEDLLRKRPFGVNDTLKALVMRTRTMIINDDKLRASMNEEQQTLEDILRWIEETEI